MKRSLSPAGRDGARPLQGDREWPGGGVRSPRPTGATQVVPSNGPMYLGHGFRRPNFVPKFGASVMGIGPYAPRGTRDGPPGRRPLQGDGKAVATTQASGAARSICASGCEGWVGIGTEIIPKVYSNAGQSLSHGCAVTAPFTQGSLRGRGMRIAASLRSSQ